MYRNVIWTIFSPDQFTHVLATINPDVLLHQGTTFKELLSSSQIRNAIEKSLTKGQPAQSSNTLGSEISLAGEVLLTKGQPAQSSTTLGHEMSLWQLHLTQCCTTLGHEISLQGVHLTKGQPAESSTTLGHERSLLGRQSDQRSACSKSVEPHMAMRCLYWGVHLTDV